MYVSLTIWDFIKLHILLDCLKIANTYSGEDSGVRLDISSCVGTGKRQSEQASVEFAS